MEWNIERKAWLNYIPKYQAFGRSVGNLMRLFEHFDKYSCLITTSSLCSFKLYLAITGHAMAKYYNIYMSLIVFNGSKCWNNNLKCKLHKLPQKITLKIYIFQEHHLQPSARIYTRRRVGQSYPDNKCRYQCRHLKPSQSTAHFPLNMT